MEWCTDEGLRDIAQASLAPGMAARVRRALDGFARLCGQRWIDAELVVQRVESGGVTYVTYRGASFLERLASVWEDWVLVGMLPNRDNLERKLKQQSRFENVDLELSVAATLLRAGTTVELEPVLPSGRRADCSCTVGQDPRVYVEVSRRSQSQALKDEQEDLALMAGCAASRLSPGSAGTVVVHDLQRRADVRAWLQVLRSVDADGGAVLPGVAEFFISPPGGYDPARGLDRVRDEPHAYMIQQATLPPRQVLGCLWAHMPDFRGCDNKIREKSAQLSGELGVIVVDVTGIAGGDADWRAHTLALFGDAAHRHVRAVVLTNVVCESAGTRRQVVVVHNSAATGEPSDSTLERIFAVENWR